MKILPAARQTRSRRKSETSSLKILLKSLAVLFAFLLALTAAQSNAQAEGVIGNPGAHNQYKWELEPQLVLRTHSGNWGGYGDGCCWGGYGNGWVGIGPGVRVAIPFMHNGPISEINNNIGISFGASTTWHSAGRGRDAVVLNLPVAFQWNFYFTEIISVLGEAGLNTPVTFWNGGTHLDVEPLIQAGGRFQFGKVGIIGRIGWPLFSVGANFQF